MSLTIGEREQRLAALQRANAQRAAIARTRRDLYEATLREGCALVADMLEHPTPVVLAMPIGRLLRAIRKLGVRNAERMCSTVMIRSMDRRVDQLSERQRRALAGVLRRYAEGRR